MSEFHKELLSEIIHDWNVQQVDTYILLLENRAIDLNDWIRHLKTIRRKKSRRILPDTGTRGGM